MSDTPAPPAAPSASLISTTLVVYALFGVAAVVGLASSGFPLIAPLSGIVGIIGIILAYVKRGEATGTWLASHYRWLIRTFWYSLLWGCIGAIIFVLLAIILIGLVIGYIIWVATTIWVLYRLIRGYVLFKDSEPVPGMEPVAPDLSDESVIVEDERPAGARETIELAPRNRLLDARFRERVKKREAAHRGAPSRIPA